MTFEYIVDTYRVPARLGAPVKFEGRPGKVVGVDGPYVLVRLGGEQETRRCQPTWHLTWDEECGPATRVPQTVLAAAPCWPVMNIADLGVPQWSGV